MPTINMSDALKEAYAVAPKDVVEYYTFQFLHPNWSEPAYIVYGWDEVVALLEEDALIGGVETVPGTPNTAGPGYMATFNPIPIEFTLPPTTPDEVPTFQFDFYDPSGLVYQQILDHNDDPQPIQMFLRVYLSSRMATVGPETDPPPRYFVGNVSINAKTSKVSGRCVFQDYMGRSAPFRTYTLAEFPGLRRR